MKKGIGYHLILPVILGLSLPAVANAGTPLMWTGMLHLLFGNALIGVLEAHLFSWVFSKHLPSALVVHAKKDTLLPRPRLSTVFILITGNYLSGWLGAIGTQAFSYWMRTDIYTFRSHMMLMVLGTYIATLIMEWPFVFFLCRKMRSRLKKSLHASLLLQSVSYLILIGCYAWSSDASLLTEPEIVGIDEIPADDSIDVYYIGDSDGDVYRRALHANPVKVAKSVNALALDLRPNKEEKGWWDLVVWAGSDGHAAMPSVAIPKIASSAVQQPHVRGEPLEAILPEDDSIPQFRDRVPLCIGGAHKGAWRFEGDWLGYLGGRREIPEKEHFGYYLSHPAAPWHVSSLTQIPGDQLVFGLWPRQVCFFDATSRKLALIAHGRSPLALLRE